MHVAIAEAVKEFLNSAGVTTAVGTNLNATRHAIPVKTIETEGLQVTVHPGNRSRITGTRVLHGKSFEIIVTVAEKVDDLENDTIDPLINLVENIEDELLDNDNTTMAGAQLSRIEGVPETPPFIPDTLQTDRTFFAQIPLTYVIYNG